MASNFSQQDPEEFLQHLLSEMMPETMECVEQQLAEARNPHRVVHNLMDEGIPQEEHFQKRLLPNPY